MISPPWGSRSTIRVRLTGALAAALLPVLILGAVQSSLAFRRESEARQESLAAAADRAASTARARIEAADILLQTLTPSSIGFQCAQRLTQITTRIPGYENLIRFDRAGRVACAAHDVPQDPGRSGRPWFQSLARGLPVVVSKDVEAVYSRRPALLAAVRAAAPDGTFDGALVAVIPLRSLAPRLHDPHLPRDSELALAGGDGALITLTDPRAFGRPPADWRARVAAQGSILWYGRDQNGGRRLYSASPLVGNDLYVVLAARAPGLFTWAQLDPLTGLAYPLMTFLLALVAVMLATDRIVITWISYLQRIAALYARGKMTVRPVRADLAPPEIRDLAETLEDMADAIVGRDASLRESLRQKDELMREIHHRVKNNLQVISSLLSIQQRAMVDPAARAAMSDTRQRITALALIYRALYQGPSLRRVDLRPFLEDLIAQLLASDPALGGGVATEIRVDPLIIDPDQLAPLALFTVEAITNAQKHAFAGRGGRLWVDFQVRGDRAELTIGDDGAAPAPALQASGVGRTLMTAFARQLRGESGLRRNEHGGITVSLCFPVAAAAPARRTQAANSAAAA